MPSKLINIALRGAEAVFASVVLALSITLIKGQVYGTSPSATNYSAFVGGITLLGALVGLASTWIELLQSILGIGIDVAVLLFNLAGGIAVAVKIGSINCSSGSDAQRSRMFNNALINGGCGRTKLYGQDYDVCAYGRPVLGFDSKTGEFSLGDWDSHLNSRCKENQAEAAFMLINVILLLATITMAWLFIKKYR
ncbi:hypothetical protein K491DRAFT_684811 [Lophiostoma macrostomum CBS 122681]|uniref:MARVEL domain-containing protein n=1 Tax=Lophiostoma macrostomum CBS 122681 TaxID=1314788 RepID=A0A6A6SPJ0_9PLEO|nr:hypothetical protein K491DRAFT_684811 [Lophiostoma macrostomum CBS 122681]